MFLSELTEAIYAAGYDFNTVQAVRRSVMESCPDIAEKIMDQPLSTVQANPDIPDDVGLRILEELSIPVETRRCP